eukprot:PITA_11163
MEAPTLISPDYTKEFCIFPFASYDTLAAVLLQKNDEGIEHLVAFFSRTLRDANLRYDLIEKQAYALIKSLNEFKIYILHSKVVSYVPLASVKDVLTQLDIDGKTPKWIAKFIEFNIEVKPTKLVKGQGLAKLMAEENWSLLDINSMALNSDYEQAEGATKEQKQDQSLVENLVTCELYYNIFHFLQKLEVPLELSSSQARAIKLISTKFYINKNFLYGKYPSGILLRCLDKEQSLEVIHQFHSSIYGGHHYWKTIAHKILKARYYCTTLFTEVFSFVKARDKCEINPHSSGQHKWILVATDYFTRWIEAIPTKNANHEIVIKFLNENIFTRIGCPTKLVINNATAFKEKELMDMTESMGIQVVHSTSYYPQGNGLAKLFNKSLVRVIKKLLEGNKKSWDSKLKFSLWADQVTNEISIGNSPFKLVYGADDVFPIQLILRAAKFSQEEQAEENDIVRRMNNLVELQQIRD